MKRIFFCAVFAAASACGSPSIASSAFTKSQIKLLEGAYEATNGLCRGGVSDLDGNRLDEQTYQACDRRKAIANLLVKANRCYVGRGGVEWRLCTADERSNLAATANEWMSKAPAGIPLTSAFTKGRWNVLDHLTDPFRTNGCKWDGQFEFPSGEPVSGSFLARPGDPELWIPWDQNTVLVASVPEYEEEGRTADVYMLKRCR